MVSLCHWKPHKSYGNDKVIPYCKGDKMMYQMNGWMGGGGGMWVWTLVGVLVVVLLVVLIIKVSQK